MQHGPYEVFLLQKFSHLDQGDFTVFLSAADTMSAINALEGTSYENFGDINQSDCGYWEFTDHHVCTWNKCHNLGLKNFEILNFFGSEDKSRAYSKPIVALVERRPYHGGYPDYEIWSFNDHGQNGVWYASTHKDGLQMLCTSLDDGLNDLAKFITMDLSDKLQRGSMRLQKLKTKRI